MPRSNRKRASPAILVAVVWLIAASCSSSNDVAGDQTTAEPLTPSAKTATVGIGPAPFATAPPPATSAPFECPVTAPNGATPPGEQYSASHHGNEFIWTGLWPNGQVRVTPGVTGSVSADGALGMKWWWWRSIPGELRIEGRRLDGPPGGALRADIPSGYGKTGFQASGLYFSSAGCWEVTARVGDQSLSFVTEVVVSP